MKVLPFMLLSLSTASLSCASQVIPTWSPTDDASVDAPTGPASGGAVFQLQGGIDPESAGKYLTCPSVGPNVTIAVAGADGFPKLVVDGVGGAAVSCQTDAAHYVVSV